MASSFFKKTVRDVPIDGRTVLVRADYNVPLTDEGKIHDDFRIRASLPTVRYLLSHGCKVVIISHLGRPEGRDESLSLEVAARRLAQLLGEQVRFVDQTVGDKVRMAIKRAPKRSVTVLENLRFYDEEEANDQSFARKLAKDSGAAYFVQDGFGVVHRDHASTSAITLEIPSVAGLLLEKEYTTISTGMSSPKRPLVAVMGGAKVSDKIGVIEKLVDVADQIHVGGAMANTFLAESGVELGASKKETDQGQVIKRIYEKALMAKGKEQVRKFLVLPTDVAVAKSIDAAAKRETRTRSNVQNSDIILDIGDDTIERYSEVIKTAGTVIWNGTMGYAELPQFAHGSARVALELAKNSSITSIIGGGDTADFVINWDGKKGESFTHVSTGGGASLELMSGQKLPGVEHLLDA